MRSGSTEVTKRETKAPGARAARTALLVLAVITASFGVTQGAPAAFGAHSAALPPGVAVPAGGGSGEGPNS